MLFFLLLSTLVVGDVYMHNPRGANDRNCERNVNRNNGNLLYDTQNNAKGGYACPRAVAASNAALPKNGLTPRMQFAEGSKLEVEWTAQHGCGLQKEAPNPVQVPSGNGNTATVPTQTVISALAENANVHCELVIQMMCASTTDPTMAYSDGAATQTKNALLAVPREGIPNSDGDAATNRIGTADPGQAKATTTANLRFGVHETPEYYNECNRVQRNRGLFTADQNVNRRSAIGTRQNPNGGRRGLECPEERDYYPYWRPSPFMDVAYLVDDASRCGVTSQTLPCGGSNTKCAGPVGVGDWVGNAQGFAVTDTNGQTANAMYGSCVTGTTGKIPKTNAGMTGDARRLYNRREWPNNPTGCAALGNAYQWKQYLFAPEFVATDPKNQNTAQAALKGAECNTMDYSRSNHLGNSGVDDTASRYTMTIPTLTATTGANRQTLGEPCLLRMRYNMSSSDYVRNLTSTSNGNASPIQQDPLVKIGNGASDVVQLALNTNQVARTFQDRSYVFYVTKPPPAMAGKEILNLNVRGKRGNIVQTYPAVEYDFIPNTIMATKDTAIAMQWIGSDYNPRRGCNDGEGGPSRGDRNVARGLNANTRGSNQNSRTDRTTLLMVNDAKVNYPGQAKGATIAALKSGTNEFFNSAAQAMKAATADAKAQLANPAFSPANLNCLTQTEINNLNNENQRENHPRNCAEGNALSPYFATEWIDFTTQQEGKTYVGFSARNNNFSNRDTKLKVMVVRADQPAVNQLPQEFVTGGTGMPMTYDTESQIDLLAEADIPGFDPVENDDYGTGAKEGCTQDMMYFDAAPHQASVFQLMICTMLCVLYALF